ncbi:MAG: arsenate reductase ArsC [Methanoregulaceae archaeon]|nr:arsenate reductase ArsC [Methanoregulaceae archaeon]
MAEGYLKARYGDRYEAFSAGTHPSRISRKAIAVMKEIGIDISGYRSKSLDEYAGQELDLAVTLCDRAGAVCPVVPFAKETIHQSFPDPGGFTGTEEEVMARTREVRDEIARWIDSQFGNTYSN